MIQHRFFEFEKSKGDDIRYQELLQALKTKCYLDNPIYKKMAQLFHGGNLKDKAKWAVAAELKKTDPKLALWIETNDSIFFPRGLSSGVYDNQTVPGTAIKIESRIHLKPHQIEPVETVTNEFGDIINADTGAGKTVMGIEIACRLKRKTCIVVNKCNLMGQWIDRIKEFTNIKKVGVMGNGKLYRGEPICVSMVQTLLGMPYHRYKGFYDSFGVVLFDEVHRFGGLEFRHVVDNFPSWRRIGFTATIERNDEFNVFLFSVGGRVVKVPASDVLVPDVYFIRTKYFGVNDDYNHYLQSLVDNSERNSLIIKTLCSALEKNRKIMVLSHRVNHVEKLFQMYQGADAVHITPKNQNQIRITSETKVIFATFQLIGEGFDQPAFDTQIYGTPFRDPISCKQIPGRILRVCEGKKKPMVIDLVDQDTRSQHYARQRLWQYEANKFHFTNPKTV